MAATYRYLFAHNVSGLQDDAATYCLGVGRRSALSDPPPELLAALSDVRPEVEPASQCRIGAGVVGPDGRPALLFSLTPAVCGSADNCLFEGGYYEGNLSASHSTYRARSVNGRWQVTPVGPGAVS